jgi:hypothetical protein
MKYIFRILLFVYPYSILFAQNIGKFETEIQQQKLSNYKTQNYINLDLYFNDGSFGLGTHYRAELTEDFSVLAKIFMTESKDNEIEIYNPWTGQFEAIDKKNRILIVPLNFGIQYRLFSDIITETFRPYVTVNLGPTFVMATPYNKEFFSAFRSGTYYTAASGSISLGAYIGKVSESLFGMSMEYYFIRTLNKNGIEGLNNKFRKDLGGFYINLIIGTSI